MLTQPHQLSFWHSTRAQHRGKDKAVVSELRLKGMVVVNSVIFSCPDLNAKNLPSVADLDCKLLLQPLLAELYFTVPESGIYPLLFQTSCCCVYVRNIPLTGLSTGRQR